VWSSRVDGKRREQNRREEKRREEERICVVFRRVPMLDASVKSPSLDSQSSSELEASCVASFIGERVYIERLRSA
jgi:hypothetical protein